MTKQSSGQHLATVGRHWILGANITGAGWLEIAGAPWWGIALLLLVGGALCCVVRILHAVMPHGSADRRAIILALLAHNASQATDLGNAGAGSASSNVSLIDQNR